MRGEAKPNAQASHVYRKVGGIIEELRALGSPAPVNANTYLTGPTLAVSAEVHQRQYVRWAEELQLLRGDVVRAIIAHDDSTARARRALQKPLPSERHVTLREGREG